MGWQPVGGDDQGVGKFLRKTKITGNSSTTHTIDDGTQYIDVIVRGGQGGSDPDISDSGGRGGVVYARFNVDDLNSDTFYMRAGSAASDSSAGSPGGGSGDTWSSYDGGGGGGRSEFRYDDSSARENFLVVAGGGGGASGGDGRTTSGADAGGLEGDDATNTTSYVDEEATGGTQTSAGDGAEPREDRDGDSWGGEDGSGMSGGDGGDHAGAGGAGWYGGGGGGGLDDWGSDNDDRGSAGAGGSSFARNMAIKVYENTSGNTGDGQVILREYAEE